MHLVEFKCKKCGYDFTRLFKNKSDIKVSKEKCIKCGGSSKKINEIPLEFLGGDCSNCQNRDFCDGKNI